MNYLLKMHRLGAAAPGELFELPGELIASLLLYRHMKLHSKQPVKQPAM